MTHKIGIISDIHATLKPLQHAIDIFDQHKVKTIICAGDIAGYGQDQLDDVINTLISNRCLCIAGNHDNPDDLRLSNDARHFLSNLPDHLALEIEGVSIYVAHAEPPNLQHGGIKILDPKGNVFPDRLKTWEEKLQQFSHDILIVGHTHQVFQQLIASTLVINPGSSYFNHSCAILDLPEREVELFALSGKEIVPTWNWGIFHKENALQQN